MNRWSAIDPDDAEAIERNRFDVNEDRRVGIAKLRLEQAPALGGTLGAQAEEGLDPGVVLGQRDPEGRDAVEVVAPAASHPSGPGHDPAAPSG